MKSFRGSMAGARAMIGVGCGEIYSPIQNMNSNEEVLA